jgi:hypothetical protein
MDPKFPLFQGYFHHQNTFMSIHSPAMSAAQSAAAAAVAGASSHLSSDADLGRSYLQQQQQQLQQLHHVNSRGKTKKSNKTDLPSSEQASPEGQPISKAAVRLDEAGKRVFTCSLCSFETKQKGEVKVTKQIGLIGAFPTPTSQFEHALVGHFRHFRIHGFGSRFRGGG